MIFFFSVVDITRFTFKKKVLNPIITIPLSRNIQFEKNAIGEFLLGETVGNRRAHNIIFNTYNITNQKKKKLLCY